MKPKHRSQKTIPDIEGKLERGELKTLAAAAKLSGYGVKHLQRLCRRREISHLRRGPRAYFFTSGQIADLFQHVEKVKAA